MTRFLRRLHQDDRGDAAVAFVLTLPIFLVIVAIIVQFALILNAKIMIDHATQVAARAAAVALPENSTDDDRRTEILKSASLALEPLSPKATSATDEGTTVAAALKTAGASVADSFAQRYSYAQAATSVTWTPDNTDYRRSPATEVSLTLTYQFYLTVPGAMRFVGSAANTPGGLSGRTLTISSTRKFITSPGREAFGTDNLPSP